MPIKQELLSFPICKAVASQGKSGRTGTVAKKSNAENSRINKVVEVDILSPPANKADASHYNLNPRKTFRQQRTTRLTPTVSSTHPISYFETSVSPEGQQATVLNRHLCRPKKLTYERELSPKPASPSRRSSRSLTPKKRTDSKVNKQRSTRQNESLDIYRETSASPRKHIMRANEGSDKDEKLSTMKKPLHRREFSPEISFPSHRCTGASSRSVTPNINSRSREGERGHETPSKRKILSPDVAECQSPSKRPLVVLERIPKECVDKLPGLGSPSLSCITSPASPQSRQNTPLSPVQLCAPSKSVVNTKTLVPKMEKPPISPTGQSPTVVPHTPDHLATHTNSEWRSPTRSGVKQLNVNSPLKSPMKPLLLSSPRRSPRKFSDENAASPQKNLRKAAGSPSCLSTPSSLVSRLSVNSPSSCRKNLALSLSKPDDAADCQSPSKRPLVVLERIPKECVDKLPGLVSPSLNCVTSPASPQSRQNTPLSPVQLCAPSKSVVSAKTLVPKVEKPPISPTGRSPTVVPHTPDRLATHTNSEWRSPVRSGVKRLNVNSPLKSPMKPLLLSSPRRSPRKFSDENAASPQKNLRKAAGSSSCLRSPSSLVSRLSVNSPSSCRKNLALSLSKPDVSVYRALRQSLSTGTPSVLVCREKQAGEIREFLTQHLTKGKPGSLYISGAPGTGKTASLISNLETLGAKRVKKVFLNCMTLKTAAAIYKAIAAELGLSVNNSERENRNAIEGKLTASRQPILLMLDEVDQLDSKNQEVLYTIFEWPALPSSSLVLVGIANSLDLTDRILPRLQARPYFKPKLLHFPPYSKAEIVHIINHRIKEADVGDAQVIRPSAIQLLAGKVAAIAGDVRKALDVCRRAVELCEGQACRQAVLKPSNASLRKASNKPVKHAVPCLVEIPQILSIFNEVYGSRVVSAVTGAPESFPLQQKLLVCCLLLIIKYAHSKDVTLGKFHEVYTRVCKKQQVPGMDQTEFLSVCTLLESRGMFQMKRNKEVRSSKVLLLLNAKEAEVVLGDQHLLATVLEDRESLGKLCSQKN